MKGAGWGGVEKYFLVTFIFAPERRVKMGAGPRRRGVRGRASPLGDVRKRGRVNFDTLPPLFIDRLFLRS